MKHPFFSRALLALAILLAAPAHASFTVVNKQGNFVSATTNTQTISIAAGHSVVAYIFASGGSLTNGTVTDSAGDTCTIGNVSASFGNAFLVGTATCLSLASSITSVTYTPTGAPVSVVGLIVWDVTATGPISVASSLAVTYPNTAPATTDGVTTGSLSITSTDGLILAGANDGTTAGLVIGTGFTQDVSFNSAFLVGEHKAIAASAAATFTAPAANDRIFTAGVALQVTAPVVTNGVVMSNGHPVQSGTSILYQ